MTLVAPYVDESATYGHAGIASPSTLNAPFLDGGQGFAADIQITSATSALAVYNGATQLDQSFARSFQDDLTGPGNFSLTLHNDDADMPAYDDVLRFQLDGVSRFAGVVRQKTITTHGDGDNYAKVTRVSGPGALALLDEALVEPARGLDAVPVELTRTFAWMSTDYNDTAWPLSKGIRRTDQATARYPYRKSPEWWPSSQSWWVWANQADVTELDAPLGRCLFRQTFTMGGTDRLAIFVGLDNFGTVYFDGAEIVDTENDASSYVVGRRVEIDVSAGDHVISANVKNLGRGGGFNFAIWSVDEEGLLDTEVLVSHPSNTLCLAYPNPPPGFTAGEAIRLVVEEAQARDELQGITLGFSDTLDSDGEAWPIVPEITCDVGRTVLEFVESLSDWLVDVQMAPGSNELRMWNWGTRGGTPGITIAATTNPLTSEVEALVHEGRYARCNRLMIRYKGGYTQVTDPTSIAAIDERSAFLDLGKINTEQEAQSIGAALLELRKDPSYSVTCTLAPVSNVPYETFDNGDTITHPDEAGSTSASRVRSIAVAQDDDNAAITYMLELNDTRREIEERQDNWLKRAALGFLAGGAKVATSSGEALGPAVRISTTNVAEFSYDNVPLVASASPRRPADSSGNLIEIYATLTTAGSTDTDLVVLQKLDGVVTTLGTTVTIPAGLLVGELDLAAAKCLRNVYEFQVEITAAGAGAEGLDVQVRAI